MIHLLWLLRTYKTKSMTAKSVLVLPEYWSRGVVVLLMDGLLSRAVAKGYNWVDMSITSADNPTSVITAEKLGSEIYKRWQIDDYPIE
jgi:L-amino acid N-acyltransferase YncA